MIIELDKNKIDVSQWDALVQQSSVASFFQTCQCLAFYESLPFFKSFAFGVQEDGQLSGVIVGYIQQEKNRIRQFFTRRAIIPGGALLSDTISDEALRRLLNFCREQLQSEAIFVEFRNFNSFEKHKAIFAECGFTYAPHLNFHNATTSEDEILARLGKSRKRDVKLAEKNGYLVESTPSASQIKEYYDMLFKMYREKVKTPLFPLRFFLSLSEIPESHFFFILENGQIEEGVVCVSDGKTMYEWFACGKKSHTYATYQAMLFCSRNNMATYDMMGAGKPDEPYGVRDYKAQFGGELVEYGRFLCICDKLMYAIGKLGVRIIKR